MKHHLYIANIITAWGWLAIGPIVPYRKGDTSISGQIEC